MTVVAMLPIPRPATSRAAGTHLMVLGILVGEDADYWIAIDGEGRPLSMRFDSILFARTEHDVFGVAP